MRKPRISPHAEKELKRRMERLAQGLPVTMTNISDRTVIPKNGKWQVAKWGHSGRRIFSHTCECGKVTQFALIYADRKINWSVYEPILRGEYKKKRDQKERTYKRVLDDGSLTIPAFMAMLKKYEYEPKQK